MASVFCVFWKIEKIEKQSYHSKTFVQSALYANGKWKDVEVEAMTANPILCREWENMAMIEE